jgi:hypothetical protein
VVERAQPGCYFAVARRNGGELCGSATRRGISQPGGDGCTSGEAFGSPCPLSDERDHPGAHAPAVTVRLCLRKLPPQADGWPVGLALPRWSEFPEKCGHIFRNAHRHQATLRAPAWSRTPEGTARPGARRCPGIHLRPPTRSSTHHWTWRCSPSPTQTNRSVSGRHPHSRGRSWR